MGDLKGRLTMVVGGTGNVGRHLVWGQLAAGATVIVPSRSPEKLEGLMDSTSARERDRLVGELLDITNDEEARKLIDRHGPVDGAAVSLGGFVPAPSVLDAAPADLQYAFDGYVFNHLSVARALLSGMRHRRAAYVMINGPLAFNAMMPGTGLVSIATAAQAMLSRVLFQETKQDLVRVNDLVIYSSFGWGNDEANEVTGSDIGRFVAGLLSEQGATVKGQTIHLRTKADAAVPATSGV